MAEAAIYTSIEEYCYYFKKMFQSIQSAGQQGRSCDDIRRQLMHLKDEYIDSALQSLVRHRYIDVFDRRSAEGAYVTYYAAIRK